MSVSKPEEFADSQIQWKSDRHYIFLNILFFIILLELLTTLFAIETHLYWVFKGHYCNFIFY